MVTVGFFREAVSSAVESICLEARNNHCVSVTFILAIIMPMSEAVVVVILLILYILVLFVAVIVGLVA